MHAGHTAPVRDRTPNTGNGRESLARKAGPESRAIAHDETLRGALIHRLSMEAPADSSFVGGGRSQGSLHRLMQRRSTLAFVMTLPLITLMIVLVAYPAGSALYLSMLD